MTLRDQARTVIVSDTRSRGPGASTLVHPQAIVLIRFFGIDRTAITMRLTEASPFRNEGVLPQALGATSRATTELLCGYYRAGALSRPHGSGEGDCLHESFRSPVAVPEADPRGGDGLGPTEAGRRRASQPLGCMADLGPRAPRAASKTRPGGEPPEGRVASGQTDLVCLQGWMRCPLPRQRARRALAERTGGNEPSAFRGAGHEPITAHCAARVIGPTTEASHTTHRRHWSCGPGEGGVVVFEGGFGTRSGSLGEGDRTLDWANENRRRAKPTPGRVKRTWQGRQQCP